MSENASLSLPDFLNAVVTVAVIDDIHRIVRHLQQLLEIYTQRKRHIRAGIPDDFGFKMQVVIQLAQYQTTFTRLCGIQHFPLALGTTRVVRHLTVEQQSCLPVPLKGNWQILVIVPRTLSAKRPRNKRQRL